jgi:hypothetical protein
MMQPNLCLKRQLLRPCEIERVIVCLRRMRPGNTPFLSPTLEAMVSIKSADTITYLMRVNWSTSPLWMTRVTPVDKSTEAQLKSQRPQAGPALPAA